MIALDFETYYDDDYSLTNLSTYDYVHDAKFDAYLMSVYTSDFQWVGHPKDFDWARLHDQVLLAHNAGFDGLVFARLQELGVVPKTVVPKGWVCTADLAAYMRCYRNLKQASKQLLGLEMDKTIREHLKGTAKSNMATGALDEAAKAYALKDSKHCYMLAEKYLDKWPECEQEYSRRLREACWRGLPVNVAKAKESYEDLCLQRFELLRAIPWVDDGEKPLSHHALRRHARTVGIPVPASLAKDSPDAMAWFDKYAEEYPWIKAVRDYRSINAHCLKVETVYKGARADGTLPLQIKYFGAHTGRTSAGTDDESGGKFNPLNMVKGKLFGVDLRSLFAAPKGYVFVICDYAQIEARLLLWRAGDKEFLKLVETEGNIYQAYAKRVRWYDGHDLKEENVPLYERAKMSVLQLGFQSGAAKFRSAAKARYNADITAEEAQKLVTEYREGNPLIVDYWAQHQQWIRFSANHRDPTHEVVLASGRVLTYFEPQWVKLDVDKYRQTRARTLLGGELTKLYGGLLTENECQATARDVVRDGRIAVERAGHNVVLDVYDELVCMVPENEAKDRADDIKRLMITSSPWAEGAALGASYKISDCYLK